MNNYKKEKREEYDYCNICGKKEKLTWDHVPPKCCNNQYSIKTNSWMGGLPKDNKYDWKYQNGIKFRSLCSKCNNELLGRNYDTVLAEFTNDIMQLVNSTLVIPPIFHQPVKINRLCRAICGHLLAAKNFYDDKCIIDEELRKYVLDMESLPPKGMSLMYWVYPYSTICLMRDVNVKSFSSAYYFPEGTISIMNSVPVAYVLSTEKEEKCGLIDLFEYCNSDIDAEVYIPIKCDSCYFPGSNNLRSYLWPCNISDSDDGAAFLLGNSENMNDSKVAQHSIESVKRIKMRQR